MTQPTSPGGKAYWIVVANAASAVVYTRGGWRDPLSEHLSLHNEAARKKIDELISDRGGRSFDSLGHGRHTMTREKVDPKRHAAEAFARQIAERIGEAVKGGKCRGFVLVAAPRFLGILRHAVAKATSVEAVATVSKDVVGRTAAEIHALLESL